MSQSDAGGDSRFTCLVFSRQTGGLLLSELNTSDRALDLDALCKLLAALHRFAANRVAGASARFELCNRRVLVAPADDFLVALVVQSTDKQTADDASIRAAIVRDVLHERYGGLLATAVADDLERVTQIIETDTAAQQLAYKKVLRVELRGRDGTVLDVHTTPSGLQLTPFVGSASVLHQLSAGTLTALLDTKARWSSTYLKNPCQCMCVLAINLQSEYPGAVAGAIVYCSAALPEGELPECPLAPLALESLRPVYFKSCTVTSQLPSGVKLAVEACIASVDSWFSSLQQAQSATATPAATPAKPPRVFHASPNPLMAPAPPSQPKRARPAGLEAARNPRHAQLQSAQHNEVDSDVAEIASDLNTMSCHLAAAAEGWEEGNSAANYSGSSSNSAASREETSDSAEQSADSVQRRRTEDEIVIPMRPEGYAAGEADNSPSSSQSDRREALEQLRQQLQIATADVHTEDEWSDGGSVNSTPEHRMKHNLSNCMSPATDDDWSDASCPASPQLPVLPLGALKHEDGDLNGWHEEPSRLSAKPAAKSVTATPSERPVIGVPFDTAGPEHKCRPPQDRPALPRNAWRTPRDGAAAQEQLEVRLQPMRQPNFELEMGSSDVMQPRSRHHTSQGKYDIVLDNGGHKFEFDVHDGAATARAARGSNGLNRLVVAD